jgi:zinc protease
MKKSILILYLLLIATIINAQTLDAIIKNYSSAMKSDKLASAKTIKITGKVSSMGMEIPIVIYIKNPDKIKIAYNIGGQNMFSVFDGQKGYATDPLNGSGSPIDITGDLMKQIQTTNIFSNELLNYYKNKQLTLEGTENVNNKPAYKIKAIAGKNTTYMFLDKNTCLLIKTSNIIDQMGTSMNIETLLSDYSESNGIMFPKKTMALANGMETARILFDKVEIDIPMNDSDFKVK